jgi:hypothetical protein
VKSPKQIIRRDTFWAAKRSNCRIFGVKGVPKRRRGFADTSGEGATSEVKSDSEKHGGNKFGVTKTQVIPTVVNRSERHIPGGRKVECSVGLRRIRVQGRGKWK